MNDGNAFRELINILSAGDGFMNGGHRIINGNRARVGSSRKNADWARSDRKVQELLFLVFPRLKQDSKDPETLSRIKRQRDRAGRWMRVIQLHYRLGLSYGDTAAEMGVKPEIVRGITQRMRRAVKGLPTDGRKIRSRRSYL